MNETTLIPMISLGWLLLCSLAAFTLGVAYFSKRTALYMKLITYGMGCFAMSNLVMLLQLWTKGEVTMGFQIGTLGYIGGMAFLFTASYGQIDGLVDDRTRAFIKYRVIALLAPLAIFIIMLPVLIGTADLEVKAIVLVQGVFTAGAAYFNLKHLIIPDVELGIVKSVRRYNLVALVLELLAMLDSVASSLLGEAFAAVCAAGLGVAFLLLIPALTKGVKKWTL